MVTLRTCFLLAVSITAATGQRFLQAADEPSELHQLSPESIDLAVQGMLGNADSEISEKGKDEDGDYEDLWRSTDEGRVQKLSRSMAGVFERLYDDDQGSEADDDDRDSHEQDVFDIFAPLGDEEEEDSDGYGATPEAQESEGLDAEEDDDGSAAFLQAEPEARTGDNEDVAEGDEDADSTEDLHDDGDIGGLSWHDSDDSTLEEDNEASEPLTVESQEVDNEEIDDIADQLLTEDADTDHSSEFMNKEDQGNNPIAG